MFSLQDIKTLPTNSNLNRELNQIQWIEVPSWEPWSIYSFKYWKAAKGRPQIHQPNPPTSYHSWFVLCDKTFSGEGQHKCLLYSSKTDKTKVQFGESMSFMGLTFRNMGKGFHTGLEMTQGQLHYPHYLAMGDTFPGLGTWSTDCTTCRQPNSLESVLSKCCSWSTPLPESSASFFFSQTTSLFSMSSL